ncbi:hypothetical protein Asi03nite_11930 [Actinoplanes siamensis]|uniref:Uncharacterized protein n=1 Tax=Actinoplanes siamensis TaxID=1223317 RepID=A0A919TI91_9ACTN|nr:hypothetical protein Asi03nite_11930 [Actinoplanes siamensis]
MAVTTVRAPALRAYPIDPSGLDPVAARGLRRTQRVAGPRQRVGRSLARTDLPPGPV